LTDNIENIIEGCRLKNPKAQHQLYEQLSARMFGVCLRYSGSYEDAQDVLHESFLKVFEKIGQFLGNGSFEGWVRRIMVNTALEKYRNRYKIINIQDNIAEAEGQGYEELAENMTVNELMQFIQELSPKYRLVFNLYAIEGYSHKEISEMLSITEGTSKSNLSRARMILQEKVKKYYNLSIRTGMTL
jgi:RNA polymerase sigma factor (sigma-70 family)